MAKHKTDDTGLVLASDVIGPALGRAILEKAQEANRTALEGAIVASVQGFQVQLKKQRDYLRQCEENIALLESKLKAIAAGQVRVSTYGEMTFVDKQLGAAPIRMKECINCGATDDTRQRGR